MTKKEKSKMGRPRMKNRKKVKEVLIAVRVSAEEKARLTREAKAAGMNFSAYLMAPHRKGR